MAEDVTNDTGDHAEAMSDDGALPRSVRMGETPTDILARIRVVDVETGERIDKVIAADAEAGTVTRYAVENGALVLENDRFKVIEESRAIAIEWLGTKRKNSF
ncbi:hypothetical protein LL251_17080 [Sphingobium naphthae]|nr:hypothetical protein [Sphingobium naphthae]